MKTIIFKINKKMFNLLMMESLWTFGCFTGLCVRFPMSCLTAAAPYFVKPIKATSFHMTSTYCSAFPQVNGLLLRRAGVRNVCIVPLGVREYVCAAAQHAHQCTRLAMLKGMYDTLVQSMHACSHKTYFAVMTASSAISAGRRASSQTYHLAVPSAPARLAWVV